ncbi:MAG: hypothetical protein KDA36_13735, partial [Planctomycetaceae bacterium]|nr:hypothetical protein [Planctomycetaceae bacterium]
VGCTVCHEGQGSATEFKWVSHTPNTPEEAAEWSGEHGWFDNHHWIYPMYPTRFAESACLKCHHTVNELEPSEQFPDPPAPQLMAGYDLVRTYGCFGCHEINGYENAKKTLGPDLRLEPNFFAAAQALLADPAFAEWSPESQGWAKYLITHPQDDAVRRDLRAAVLADAATDEPVLHADSHALAEVLKDVEIPGTYR